MQGDERLQQVKRHTNGKNHDDDDDDDNDNDGQVSP